MALDARGPQYVTVIGQTDAPQAWRANKATGGAILQVTSNETIATGFSMPHSPRIHANNLWVLDSGRGKMLRVDSSTGKHDVVCDLPGYTRGLSFCGNYAFVGLSRIRETSVFGGLPIAERRDALKCGVGIIALHSGKLVAHLEFTSGVEEIFAVEVLVGMRNPTLSGPHAHVDGTTTIWSAPSLQSLNRSTDEPDNVQEETKRHEEQ
jgi:uncharacterized protein (TIGR03032 family)